MNGKRIVYTGDFGRGAKPIPCNILVMDSTHGDPMFSASVDPESLERRLVEYVDEEIQNSKNILVRAHRGRLQYTMHLLDRALPKEMRFLAHQTDINLIPVYRKYGMQIRDCTSYESEEGRNIQEGNAPYVEFRTHGRGSNFLEGSDKMAVFNMGGRFLGGGTTIRTNDSYHLEFMDHADYDSVIEYVRGAEPQYVVTDYARGKQGKKLAEAIEQGLGIKAIARPIG